MIRIRGELPSHVVYVAQPLKRKVLIRQVAFYPKKSVSALNSCTSPVWKGKYLCESKNRELNSTVYETWKWLILTCFVSNPISLDSFEWNSNLCMRMCVGVKFPFLDFKFTLRPELAVEREMSKHIYVHDHSSAVYNVLLWQAVISFSLTLCVFWLGAAGGATRKWGTFPYMFKKLNYLIPNLANYSHHHFQSMLQDIPRHRCRLNLQFL